MNSIWSPAAHSIEICNAQIEGDLAEKIQQEANKRAENFGNTKVGKIRFDISLINLKKNYIFIDPSFGIF